MNKKTFFEYKDFIFCCRKDTYDEGGIKEVIGGTYSRYVPPVKGEVWLDLGGNIGAFASVYGKVCKRVVSVEPSADNVTLYKKNVRLNGVASKARIIHAAAVGRYRENNQVSFYLSKYNKGAHSLRIKRGREEITVPAVHILDLLDKYKPTAIKMDVEGAEAELLPHINFEELKLRAFLLEYHFSALREVNQPKNYFKLLTRLKKNFSYIHASENPKGSWHTVVRCHNYDID